MLRGPVRAVATLYGLSSDADESIALLMCRAAEHVVLQVLTRDAPVRTTPGYLVAAHFRTDHARHFVCIWLCVTEPD